MKLLGASAQPVLLARCSRLWGALAALFVTALVGSAVIGAVASAAAGGQNEPKLNYDPHTFADCAKFNAYIQPLIDAHVEIAQTKWKSSYTYLVPPGYHNVWVDQFKIDWIRIRLPSYTLKRGTLAQKRAISELIAAIRRHELGHAQLVNEFLHEFPSQQVSRGVDSPEAGHRAWAEWAGELQKLSDQYDTATANGQHQSHPQPTRSDYPVEGFTFPSGTDDIAWGGCP